MPAHCTERDVGCALRSDGVALTATDLASNALVDSLAKRGAISGWHSLAALRSLASSAETVQLMARWLATVSVTTDNKDTGGARPRVRLRERRRRRSGGVGVTGVASLPAPVQLRSRTERLLEHPRLVALRSRLSL